MKTQQGFTLIEIAIVLVIIVIIFGVGKLPEFVKEGHHPRSTSC